jgi:predicted HD superfamily hydrolase involved in NAD metabolism
LDPILKPLTANLTFSGSIPLDAAAFLIHHNCPRTAEHSRQVAETAAALAEKFGLDPVLAAQAGWLHDTSAVFPNRERLAVAQQLNLEILPEEARLPLLLHQKISVEIARQIFDIDDPAVLGAIGCHTTLRASPTRLDLLLFVADKLAWDQNGQPPYTGALQEALSRSLEEAAWIYQEYLLNSGKLEVVHPWMQTSNQELKTKIG